MNLTSEFLCDNFGKIFFLLRIPFTRINLMITLSGKPHEGQAKKEPVYSQEDAVIEAAKILGCNAGFIKAGETFKRKWIYWNGITWNAKTWNKILKDIARYTRRKSHIPSVNSITAKGKKVDSSSFDKPKFKDENRN